MTQWTEHDGYMCQACLPIIQVTAKSKAINNSQSAFLLLNNFTGRSGKGCIHTVYMHFALSRNPPVQKRPREVGMSMSGALWRFFFYIGNHQQSAHHLRNKAGE